MRHRTLVARLLRAALFSLVLVSVAGSLAVAQTSAQEAALTLTAEDSRIQWGPCPPFLPAGCAIAVVHGDPARDNVDVFFKVPARSILPLHWHTSAERMVLLAGELHVTYDGQAPVVLRPGSYAYGPAKLPHKGVCASDVACILFIAFESPLDAVAVESAGREP